MTEEELKVELGRAYRCIQGMHNTMQAWEVNFPAMAYHSPTIAAAKRFVFEGALDGAEYFIGKPVSVMHEALALGT